MLTQEEKNNILGTFPNIKLSYENIIHKKVLNSDLILAIPDGTKCFAWFTTLNDRSVCIIFELENNNNKEIKNIKIANTCFSTSLSYGTIVYGTLFYHMRNSFFCIEDIFRYKGNDISGENWNSKFKQISTMFKKDIKQISYNNSFIVFGLPIIVKSNEELTEIIDKSLIKYKLHSIQYRQLNRTSSSLVLSIEKFTTPNIEKFTTPNIEKFTTPNIEKFTTPNIEKFTTPNIEKFTTPNIEKFTTPNIEKFTTPNIENKNKIKPFQNSGEKIIFEVKPDIQNDIYHLYCDGDEYYGTACIPDFKTSMMMNKLFRKIKENNDLDKLEESDDEEEFENPNIDKFVYLDKIYKFECQLNKRFKKWVPYKLVDEKSMPSKSFDIKNVMNKLLTKPIKYYK